MLGFRIREGVDLAEIEGRHRVSIYDANRELVERWVENGYLRREGTRLRPTLRGFAAADALAGSLRILPDRSP